MKKIILLITILLSFRFSNSQAQNNWQVIMKNGDAYSKVLLIDVISDSLVINQLGLFDLIPIDSIFELRQACTSNSWTGAALGGMIGYVFGYIIGKVQIAQDHSFGSGLAASLDIPIGALIGVLIGGGIAASDHDTTTHDLSRMNLIEKELYITKYIDVPHS